MIEGEISKFKKSNWNQLIFYSLFYFIHSFYSFILLNTLSNLQTLSFFLKRFILLFYTFILITKSNTNKQNYMIKWHSTQISPLLFMPNRPLETSFHVHLFRVKGTMCKPILLFHWPHQITNQSNQFNQL